MTGATVRAKLISAVVAALLLLPVAANADDLDGIVCSYDDQLADACVEIDDTDVLADVSDRDDLLEESVVASETVSDDEVEAAQVLGVTQELADTGLDTWMFLAVALSLLAVGGVAIRFARRTRAFSSAN